ncbi:hypothetical protein PG990_001060 [Apiospora arundinis]
MAERMIQRACDRFANELSDEDSKKIRSTVNMDDVKLAVRQIEQQLAARRSLRNISRIRPFLDSIENYSKALEVACNGTNYLPWIWAVHEYTNALDMILNAYADIGSRMPRFCRFANNAFPDNADFRQLVAFLFEDIVEFHRKVYTWITKPAWRAFFSSQWGRFSRRFGDILDSITRTSDQIDKEAAALDIIQAAKTRRSLLEAAMEYERRQQTQQVQAVLEWLEVRDSDQEAKLEWLQSRRFDGTSQWVLKSPKIRSWLQRGHGNSELWLNGKPGSGKSVLAAQIIAFLRSDPHRQVCYFFCDFQSPTWGIGAHVLRHFCAQLVRILPDAALYVYDECLANAKRPTADTLKKLLPQLFSQASDLSLVVDGVDEIAQSEHKLFLQELLHAAKATPNTKLLILSQDLATISTQLRKLRRLSMSEEQESIKSDMALIVESALNELQDIHQGAVTENILTDVKNKIIKKAEGMHLWVHLVLELLKNASNLQDFQNQLHSIPSTLKEVYKRILDNILSRCSAADVSRIRRLFAWLIGQRGTYPLAKHMIRLGMTLFPESPRVLSSTRPFPNATDICKPLIEDGPGASLLFVHSTVHEALEDATASLHYDAQVGKLMIRLLEFLPAELGSVIYGFSLESNKEKDTPISRALGKYIETMHSLLNHTRVSGLGDADLLAFEEEYRATAFICNSFGCDRSVMGFSSRSRLSTHESIHTKPLECYQSGCSYNNMGFPNERSLRTHMKKRHQAQEPSPIPKRLKWHNASSRKYDSEDTAFNQRSSYGNSEDPVLSNTPGPSTLETTAAPPKRPKRSPSPSTEHKGKATSSYWNMSEMTDFPDLQWESIITNAENVKAQGEKVHNRAPLPSIEAMLLKRTSLPTSADVSNVSDAGYDYSTSPLSMPGSPGMG